MCGIVGIFNYSKKEKINQNLLIKMRDTMIHRGPDDFVSGYLLTDLQGWATEDYQL